MLFFFFSSRRRHTSFTSDWSSDVCSSDLRTVGIGKTMEEGFDLGRRGAEFMFGSYLKKNSNIRGGEKAAAEGKTQSNEAMLAAERDNVDPVERYVNDCALCGSPEKIIDDIER